MVQDVIYFDHNATTGLAAEALSAMLPFLQDQYGNAGSAHPLGILAEGAVTHARSQVAGFLGCGAGEIIFNSGGTEGLNHVFRGVMEAFPAKRHVVVTAVEHPATLALAQWLEGQGVEVTRLGVDSRGALDLEELEASLRPDTALLSVMAANNESGVRFPLEAIGHIARTKGVLFHSDGTQAVGKVPLDLGELPVDLFNLSAHKFHGPKGVGALFIRRGLRLKPFMIGGGQERGRRGGTENVAGIVGLGAAAELARTRLPGMARVAELRNEMEIALLERIPEARALAASSPRLPNTSLLCFRGIEGEALQQRLGEQGICVSTGSACSTGQKEPSHVLTAMGVPKDEAQGAIRVSLGRDSTAMEVERFLAVLPDLVDGLRSQSLFGR